MLVLCAAMSTNHSAKKYRRSDFNYALPAELIAQQPLSERAASRLLCLERSSGNCQDRNFAALPNLLRAGDLLVFNNTSVIKARLLGRKASGGKLEVLVERLCSETEVLAHVRASKSPKPGTMLEFADGVQAEMIAREGSLFRLAFSAPVLTVLDAQGHVPLPPYIEREDDAQDESRYQTVFAETPGAVAAPTAGLHFDTAMLETLRAAGVASTKITLHVGAGTFQPVRADALEEHHMHAEWLAVNDKAVAAVQAAKARGGRVIAVGTTAVRALESAARAHGGNLAAHVGDTQLFLHPGEPFHVIDGLLTNFHLPESTLVMLVAAFAGYQATMQAYEHAVEQRYRFFSYGDAMLILDELPKHSSAQAAGEPAVNKQDVSKASVEKMSKELEG